MKKIYAIILFFFAAGCSHMGVEKSRSADPQGAEKPGAYSGFTPAEVTILPLTKMEKPAGVRGRAVIRVYISMLDEFGSQIKGPAVFRFELYEKISKSSEPTGKRAVVWPDMDLREPDNNNRYWQDFLRAYKFDLDFQPQKHHSYVLQVTCLCAGARRLVTQSNLTAAE